MRRAAVAILALWGPVAAAQSRPEAGVTAVLVAGRNWFAGAGPTLAIPLSRDVWLDLAAAPGIQAEQAAVRGEAAFRYQLPARRTARWRLHGAAGLAVAAGPSDDQYLLVGVGVSRRAGRRGTAWAETGVAGGVRLAGGLRWRLGSGTRTAP